MQRPTPLLSTTLSTALLTLTLAACSSDDSTTNSPPTPNTSDASTDTGPDAPTADVNQDPSDGGADSNPSACTPYEKLQGPEKVQLTSDLVFNVPANGIDVFVRRSGSNDSFTKLDKTQDGTATLAHDQLTFAGVDYYFSIDTADCKTTIPHDSPESNPLHVKVFGFKNLTDDPSHVSSHPHINGHGVVYTTDMGGANDEDIELFDLDTFDRTPIATGPAAQRTPRVSDNWVVWIDERNESTSKLDIFGFDRSSNKQLPLITEPHTQFGLRLVSNVMAWQDYRNASDSSADGDIYVYDMGKDGLFGTADDVGEQQVTHDPTDQSVPDIFVRPDGQIVVVWEDMRDDPDGECSFEANGCDSNIYIASTGQDGVFGTADDISPRAVTKNTARQNTPVISDRWIVWRDWRETSEENSAWTLYAYDLGDDGLFGTTDDGGEFKLPVGEFKEPSSLDLDGFRLVYSDQRKLSREVYLFDMSTKSETLITNEKGIQDQCAVSGNVVVWKDGRSNTNGKRSDDIWVYVLP